MLSYVAVDKRRARKKKADLEANNEGEGKNVKGKAEAGKRLVETSKDWMRWLKQKAKMFGLANKSDGLCHTEEIPGSV